MLFADLIVTSPVSVVARNLYRASSHSSLRKSYLESSNLFIGSRETDKLRTPAKGSAERNAILDVLRQEYKSGQNLDVKFQVNHLKVHNGWTWATCTPLDESGKVIGEQWPSLLHNEDGKWVVKDLMAIAEALNDPVGPLEPSRKYLKEVEKKYPGVPADIFPKARR